MRIHKYYKVELDPNDLQKTHFARHAGAARFAYNWGLSRREEEYQNNKRKLNSIDLHKELVILKKTKLHWLNDVSKCAPHEALRDLDTAYKNYYRRLKNKERNPGLPKFKNKKDGTGGFRLLDYNKSGIIIESNRIRLPKIGWVKLKEKNYLPIGKTNIVSVKEHAGHWFVSVHTEQEMHPKENNGGVIGLDLGLTDFAAMSDGIKIKNQKFLSRAARRERRLSRAHSRKQAGGENKKKSHKKLTILHYRITCKREDFLHKLSTQLAKTKSVIVVEELCVEGMKKNRRLSRSVSDSGWKEFVEHLSYKTVWYGSKLIKADRFFPSTKKCSKCGNIKDKMELSERVYRCGVCGLIIDRDLNAAKNLAKLATAGSAECQACGEKTSGSTLSGGVKPAQRSRNRAGLTLASPGEQLVALSGQLGQRGQVEFHPAAEDQSLE